MCVFVGIMATAPGSNQITDWLLLLFLMNPYVWMSVFLSIYWQLKKTAIMAILAWKTASVISWSILDASYRPPGLVNFHSKNWPENQHSFNVRDNCTKDDGFGGWHWMGGLMGEDHSWLVVTDEGFKIFLPFLLICVCSWLLLKQKYHWMLLKL